MGPLTVLCRFLSQLLDWDCRFEIELLLLGEVSVCVELGGDETAVAGVAEMVDAYQGGHPVVEDVLGAAGGVFGGGLFGLFLYFQTGDGRKSSTFLRVVSKTAFM